MNSTSGSISSNQIRMRSQSGDWERGVWTNANENKQKSTTLFSRSQSPDWERKRKPAEIHGSLSYKVNLAYIILSFPISRLGTQTKTGRKFTVV